MDEPLRPDELEMMLNDMQIMDIRNRIMFLSDGSSWMVGRMIDRVRFEKQRAERAEAALRTLVEAGTQWRLKVGSYAFDEVLAKFEDALMQARAALTEERKEQTNE